MAKAWITDRWVKDADVALPDGSTIRVSPTPAQLKSLKSIPEHFRKARFGQGLRWAVTWREPQIDGTAPQRTKDFKLRRDAEALVAELEDDIRTGRYIDPSQRDRPFSELAEAWLLSKGKIKDATYRRYRRDLDNYVLPRWATTPVGAIKRQDIDSWIQQLRAGTAPYRFAQSKHVNKKKVEPSKLSASSVKGIADVAFHAPLRYAVQDGWIGRDPMARVELPRDETLTQKLPALDYANIELLARKALELTERKDDAVLVQMLAYPGPRIGEATALQVRDIDFTAEEAAVNRTWTVDRGGKRKLGAPKTWEMRGVPLPSFLVEELRVLCKNKEPEDFVFTAPRGGAIDGGNWYTRGGRKYARRHPQRPSPCTISATSLRRSPSVLALM
ncbi:tyrosine-type recombinase/integrase [Leucobacter luti]|uniref:tyrosine-type recombinase/integrase n=1 Tax=Leucobacter luti TaxID=340320 RepID=UPI0010516576|nr:tyrosine-type recombinase/integrase family protein [Leucobacter luti]MCW2286933.1 integrase [Leucobacter luti]